jgi:hypothetical protein
MGITSLTAFTVEEQITDKYPPESFSIPHQLFSSFNFSTFSNYIFLFSFLKMKFSIATIVTLGFAQHQHTGNQMQQSGS